MSSEIWCFWPLTAFTASEVKNDTANIITQDNCNKFIEIKFSVGCMVYVTPSTTSKTIIKIHSEICFETPKLRNCPLYFIACWLGVTYWCSYKNGVFFDKSTNIITYFNNSSSNPKLRIKFFIKAKTNIQIYDS